MDVVVGKVQYGAVGAGTVYGDRGGMIKIIGDKQYGELRRRPHRRREGDRADPGARQREGARGRLPRGRAHRARPPDAVGGRDGGRARRRRLAHPRLSRGATRARRFYYDFASPDAYLAAERVNAALPEIPEWMPVRDRAAARSAAPSRDRRLPRGRRARAARALGLQPLRWPDPFPADRSGRCWPRPTRSRSGARWRSRSPRSGRRSRAGATSSERDNVLIAAAACEMHPAAVVKGAELRGTRDALAARRRRRAAAGVPALPAIGDRRPTASRASAAARPA